MKRDFSSPPEDRFAREQGWDQAAQEKYEQAMKHAEKKGLNRTGSLLEKLGRDLGTVANHEKGAERTDAELKARNELAEMNEAELQLVKQIFGETTEIRQAGQTMLDSMVQQLRDSGVEDTRLDLMKKVNEVALGMKERVDSEIVQQELAKLDTQPVGKLRGRLSMLVRGRIGNFISGKTDELKQVEIDGKKHLLDKEQQTAYVLARHAGKEVHMGARNVGEALNGMGTGMADYVRKNGVWSLLPNKMINAARAGIRGLTTSELFVEGKRFSSKQLDLLQSETVQKEYLTGEKKDQFVRQVGAKVLAETMAASLARRHGPEAAGNDGLLNLDKQQDIHWQVLKKLTDYHEQQTGERIDQGGLDLKNPEHKALVDAANEAVMSAIDPKDAERRMTIGKDLAKASKKHQAAIGGMLGVVTGAELGGDLVTEIFEGDVSEAATAVSDAMDQLSVWKKMVMGLAVSGGLAAGTAAEMERMKAERSQDERQKMKALEKHAAKRGMSVEEYFKNMVQHEKARRVAAKLTMAEGGWAGAKAAAQLAATVGVSALLFGQMRNLGEYAVLEATGAGGDITPAEAAEAGANGMSVEALKSVPREVAPEAIEAHGGVINARIAAVVEQGTRAGASAEELAGEVERTVEEARGAVDDYAYYDEEEQTIHLRLDLVDGGTDHSEPVEVKIERIFSAEVDSSDGEKTWAELTDEDDSNGEISDLNEDNQVDGRDVRQLGQQEGGLYELAGNDQVFEAQIRDFIQTDLFPRLATELGQDKLDMEQIAQIQGNLVDYLKNANDSNLQFDSNGTLILGVNIEQLKELLLQDVQSNTETDLSQASGTGDSQNTEAAGDSNTETEQGATQNFQDRAAEVKAELASIAQGYLDVGEREERFDAMVAMVEQIAAMPDGDGKEALLEALKADAENSPSLLMAAAENAAMNIQAGMDAEQAHDLAMGRLEGALLGTDSSALSTLQNIQNLLGTPNHTLRSDWYEAGEQLVAAAAAGGEDGENDNAMDIQPNEPTPDGIETSEDLVGEGDERSVALDKEFNLDDNDPSNDVEELQTRNEAEAELVSQEARSQTIGELEKDYDEVSNSVGSHVEFDEDGENFYDQYKQAIESDNPAQAQAAVEAILDLADPSEVPDDLKFEVLEWWLEKPLDRDAIGTGESLDALYEQALDEIELARLAAGIVDSLDEINPALANALRDMTLQELWEVFSDYGFDAESIENFAARLDELDEEQVENFEQLIVAMLNTDSDRAEIDTGVAELFEAYQEQNPEATFWDFLKSLTGNNSGQLAAVAEALGIKEDELGSMIRELAGDEKADELLKELFAGGENFGLRDWASENAVAIGIIVVLLAVAGREYVKRKNERRERQSQEALSAADNGNESEGKEDSQENEHVKTSEAGKWVNTVKNRFKDAKYDASVGGNHAELESWKTDDATGDKAEVTIVRTKNGETPLTADGYEGKWSFKQGDQEVGFILDENLKVKELAWQEDVGAMKYAAHLNGEVIEWKDSKGQEFIARKITGSTVEVLTPKAEAVGARLETVSDKKVTDQAKSFFDKAQEYIKLVESESLDQLATGEPARAQGEKYLEEQVKALKEHTVEGEPAKSEDQNGVLSGKLKKERDGEEEPKEIEYTMKKLGGNTVEIQLPYKEEGGQEDGGDMELVYGKDAEGNYILLSVKRHGRRRIRFDGGKSPEGAASLVEILGLNEARAKGLPEVKKQEPVEDQSDNGGEGADGALDQLGGDVEPNGEKNEKKQENEKRIREWDEIVKNDSRSNEVDVNKKLLDKLKPGDWFKDDEGTIYRVISLEDVEDNVTLHWAYQGKEESKESNSSSGALKWVGYWKKYTFYGQQKPDSGI